MDYTTYQILHLTGLAMLALGIGGMLAGGGSRPTFAAFQGIGVLVILVTGFGMLAKGKLGFPHFAMVKLALWVVLALLPAILRKLRLPLAAGLLIPVVLVAVLAWLGLVKPALW